MKDPSVLLFSSSLSYLLLPSITEIDTAVHDRQLLRRLCEAYCLTDYCKTQRSDDDFDETFICRLIRNC
jgi:hypothetical protein